jgi:glyoxylate carboligase
MKNQSIKIGDVFYHRANVNFLIKVITPEANENLYVVHSWVNQVYTGIIRVTKKEMQECYREETEVKPDVLITGHE